MKDLYERLPAAAGAAILASGVSAFVFTLAFDPRKERALIYSFMLLSAVFTAAFRLAPVPVPVRAAAPVLCAGAGSALLFMERGSGSLYTKLLAGADIPVSAIIAPCVLLSAAVCMAVCAVNGRFVTRCAAAGGIAAALAAFAWLRVELLVPPAVLLTAYPIIVLCQICSPKDRSEGQERYDVWFIVFALALSASVYILPSPETRIQWEKVFGDSYSEWLDRLSEKLDVDKISDSRWGSETDYAEDASNIGGWVELKAGKRLRVVFSDSCHPDRLVGSIYDTYTGKGWLSTADIYGTGYFSEKDIERLSFRESDAYTKKDLYGSVKITNLIGRYSAGSEGGTVFYPAYTIGIRDSKSGEYAARGGKRMTFASEDSQDYTAYFMKLPAEDALSDEEREQWLALPEKLPERVAELALSLTENCAGDEEKAEALTEYIGGHCVYSTEIKKVPARRDLVDIFMFDTKKGYCEYFASAVAVTARCAGIPSRYVLGYHLHGSGEVYTVMSSSAHAWAELYIEGRGWVVYDPITMEPGAAAVEEERENAGISPEMRRLMILAYIFIAAGALLSALIRPFLLRTMWGVRLRGKYRAASDKKVMIACGRLLWVLSACGVKRESSETLSELGGRIARECDWLDGKAAENAGLLLEQTGKALYSPYGAERKPASRAAASVRRAYIRRFGLARYLRGFTRANLSL